MRWRKRLVFLMAVAVFSLLVALISLLLMVPEGFYLAAALMLLALVSPWVGRKMGRALLKGYEVVLSVLARILLTLIYLLVLLPWGIVYRLRQTALQRLQARTHTLFVERGHRVGPQDFERAG
jgi:hypothetical protein